MYFAMLMHAACPVWSACKRQWCIYTLHTVRVYSILIYTFGGWVCVLASNPMCLCPDGISLTPSLFLCLSLCLSLSLLFPFLYWVLRWNWAALCKSFHQQQQITTGSDEVTVDIGTHQRGPGLKYMVLSHPLQCYVHVLSCHFGILGGSACVLALMYGATDGSFHQFGAFWEL